MQFLRKYNSYSSVFLLFCLFNIFFSNVVVSQELYSMEALTSTHFIAYGGHHGCALTDTSANGGAIQCWSSEASPPVPPVGKYVDIFVSQPQATTQYSCALRTSPTTAASVNIDCWGDPSSLIGTFTTGGGSTSEVPTISTSSSGGVQTITVSAGVIVAQSIAGGWGHACIAYTTPGLWNQNPVFCFGATSGTWITSTPTTTTPARHITSLAVGATVSCFTSYSGITTLLQCWGTGLAATAFPATGDYRAVACGFQDCCAIQGNPSDHNQVGLGGTLTCWGANAGTWTIPTAVMKTVSVGTYGGCAVDVTGTSWCFGEITTETCYTPPPAGVQFIQFAASAGRLYGVSFSREIYRWGVSGLDSIDSPVLYNSEPYKAYKAWPYQDVSIDYSGVSSPCGYSFVSFTWRCYNITTYWSSGSFSTRRYEWLRFSFASATSSGVESIIAGNNKNGLLIGTSAKRQPISCPLSSPCFATTGGRSIDFLNIDFQPLTPGVSAGHSALLISSADVSISSCTFTGFTAGAGSSIVRTANPYPSLSVADSTVSFVGSTFTTCAASVALLWNTDGALNLQTTQFIGNNLGSVVSSTTSVSSQFVNFLSSTFSGSNGASAVTVSGYQSVTIESSTFSGVIAAGQAGGGLNVSLPTGGGVATPTFFSQNNVFSSCASNVGGGAVCLQHLGPLIATFDGDRFSTNTAVGNGGAICISSQHNVVGDGVITIKNAMFNGNSATRDGGAISSTGSSSKTLSVTNTTFANNIAGGSGGAIAIALGILQLNSSTLQSNRAGGNGGGVSVNTASASVYGSTLNGNIAGGFGGAFFSETSFQTYLVQSSYGSNIAGRGGGAVYLLNFVEGSVAVNTNTFTLNSAQSGGGGALYWASLGVTTQPSITLDNVYSSNSVNSSAGGWGARLASEPISVAVAGNSTWITTLQPPGQSIFPYPTFNLLDFYGQLATTGVMVQVTPTFAFSSSPSTTSASGEVVFRDLRVGLFPNSTTLPIVVTAFLQGDGMTGTLVTFSSAQIHIRACVPGEFFSSGNTAASGLPDYACVKCPTGEFGGSELGADGFPVCSECAPGKYQNQLGTTTCVECGVGEFASVGGQTICQQCQGVSYADQQGEPICSTCLTNSHANAAGSACECLYGTYAQDFNVSTPNCVNCPTGANCFFDGADSSNLVVGSGYWRDAAGGLGGIYTCPLLDGCPGGFVNLTHPSLNIISQCTEGYAGPLCAACSDGYYLVSGSCKVCSPSTKITFPVVVVVLVLFFCFMVYMGIRHRTLVRALFPWAAFKILIAYAQILSVMDIVYDIPLSSFFRNYLIGPKILLLNIFEVLAYRCNAQSSNYYTTLLFVTLAPLIVTSVLLILYMLVPQCVKHITLFRNYGHKALRNTLVNVIFVLFTFCYPGISVTTLRFFKCKQLILADGSDPWYLQADYSIECYTAKYWRYSILAIIILALIPVGMPIFLAIYLRRKSHRLHRYNTIRRVGQLYRDYRPELYYWEVEELFRKLVMAGIVMYIASGTVNQIGAGAFLGIMFHILHAVLQPFKQSAANALQHFALFAIWSTLFASLALKSGALTPQSDEANAVQALVLIVNLFVLVLGFITAFQHVTHAYKSGKHLLVAQGKDKTVMCYNDQKVLGTVRCVDCHKLYCEQCDDVIHRAPAFVNHYRKPITVEDDDDDDALSFDPKGRSNSRLGRSSSKSGPRARGETKAEMKSIVPGGELETVEHIDNVFSNPTSPKDPPASKKGGKSSPRGSANGPTLPGSPAAATGAPTPPPPSAPMAPIAPTAPLLSGSSSLSDKPTGPAAYIGPVEMETAPVKPGSLPRIPSTGNLNKKTESAPRSQAPAPPSFLQNASANNSTSAAARDSVDLNVEIGDF